MNTVFTALLLLVTAHVTPWAVGRWLGGMVATPLDGGVRLSDGERLLGGHKTWRGLVVAVLSCALLGAVLRVGWQTGSLFGALAMLGDALSSFCKRRLHVAPGVEIVGLDQLGEALLPLMILKNTLHIDVVDAFCIAAVFLILDIATTRFRHPPPDNEKR